MRPFSSKQLEVHVVLSDALGRVQRTVVSCAPSLLTLVLPL